MQQKGLSSKDRATNMIETCLQSPLVKSFLAGSVSGTCSTILFQPLDLIKTRLQSPVALGNNPSGMLNIVVNVVRNEKVLGLWRGVAPSLSRTVPGIGVYFSSLHMLRSIKGSADPPPWESILMGAGARTISGITMLPFTVVKTRYESGQFKYKGVCQALVTIRRSEGFKGLFSGMFATLLRDAPFSGFYLMIYTQAKKAVRNSNALDNPTAPWVHFSCGIFAGCFASIITQPADVIKTLMQLYPDKFGSVSIAFLHVKEKEGMKGFLRGIVPRTMRRSLMAACAWTVYDQLMKGMRLT